jgi:hypothetical protein
MVGLHVGGITQWGIYVLGFRGNKVSPGSGAGTPGATPTT